MMYFPKIDTLFERDPGTFKVITDQYRRPEFKEHDSWLINEKLDGSNISIVGTVGASGEVEVNWRGRTDRAQFPKESVAHLEQRCSDWLPIIHDILKNKGLTSIEFFGELIGPKIQNGSMYSSVVNTKFYDIRVGNALWLPWDAVLVYADKLNYAVPFYNYGATKAGIIETCREGFETFESAGTGGPAEGFICKTNIPLYNNAGKRLIFKLKHSDFA